jgi:hypothetical protein
VTFFKGYLLSVKGRTKVVMEQHLWQRNCSSTSAAPMAASDTDTVGQFAQSSQREREATPTDSEFVHSEFVQVSDALDALLAAHRHSGERKSSPHGGNVCICPGGPARGHAWTIARGENVHASLQAPARSAGDLRDGEGGREGERETGGRADDSDEAEEEEAFRGGGGGGGGRGRSAGASTDAIKGGTRKEGGREGGSDVGGAGGREGGGAGRGGGGWGGLVLPEFTVEPLWPRPARLQSNGKQVSFASIGLFCLYSRSFLPL